ncbi:MAG: Flp pilus assembly complex ATPase component TadA [Desulfomicrobium sp.]|nr:Flp pilus assembly complex ATPase component TadA [Pseudomonadota bacterium]MBV1711860.1 Flp pilus assembly complex ATPase component TadA [Desulfomicrobium sp.]MBU4571037.1 Flp pilus assembly complex ATPase component TadA [Pseudomonadota bacterium]MBU4593666.1 Flp pilus assembly complex ATPase component TadA [Pseudomonadota bacterium]MBV1719078.1 Flp pilus assembly complex ATPase component TadA [Desulfomicrobium sp.]
MLKSKLIDIKNIFQEAQAFEMAWNKCLPDLKALFEVEQIRLYKYDTQHAELFALVLKDGRPREVRMPVSSSSLAGYTAMSQLPFILKSLDAGELAAIHPNLRFDRQYDQLVGFETKNAISMPIQHDNELLGVLQLLNKQQGVFSREDEAFCRLIVSIMGQRMFEERSLPKGPYENLVFQGVLTRQQLDDATSRSAKRGVSTSRLLQLDYGVSPDDIGGSLEIYYQTPFVRFQENPVSEQMLKGINRQYLINNLWVPIQARGEKIVVLLHNPHDSEKIEEIRRILNAQEYEFRVGLPEEILAFLGDRSQLPKGSGGGKGMAEAFHEADEAEHEEFDGYDSGEDLSEALADLEEATEEGFEVSQIEEEDISQESRQLAVRFVNKIIMHAHKSGASDIHIEPSRPGRPGVVRMRIDGTCERVLAVPESIIKPVVSRIKILSNLNISERRLPQDGKAKVRFKGRELELRVATLPTVHGESAVLRMLTSGKALPFDKLNLSEANKEQIERLMLKPHGIFLVVGPTGSGKTTTLHSILARINTPDKKIWTVEDPVEITQPGLQQVQVESSIGLDFPRIMRAFLRADPDVILVGEMRDLQTAQIGVEASLTGHMVFSTLHTNSAAETVTRLLDMGIESLNFSEALHGVLAQRLVKTLCAQCREAYAPSDEEWGYLLNQYGERFFPELGIGRSDAKIYRAKGCGRCSQTGYRGRTGIHELLVATPEIRKAIARKQPSEDVALMGIEQGMRTLYQDGIAKIFKGDIDILQLQKVTTSE